MSINSSNKEDVKFILPLNLLGDRDNIVKVNNCATRLRLEVKDADKVNAEEIKKYYPAVQKISDNEVHIIVGTNAKLLAESLKKIISVYDSSSNQAFVILPLLGDKENILKINNCATRLRLEIKDINKVNIEEIKKHYPAVQKISDNEIHIVIGTEAGKIANELRSMFNISNIHCENDDKSYFSKSLSTIVLLGGIDNISKVNNCATRLRLEIKDINKVNIEEIKKYYPAVQKISDNEIHIVVGTEVNKLAKSFKELMDNQSFKSSLLLPLLGGIDNILKVNNCATRLRLEVKDINKINTEEIKKYYPAVQKISDNEVHVIVGTEANKLANELKKFIL